MEFVRVDSELTLRVPEPHRRFLAGYAEVIEI